MGLFRERGTVGLGLLGITKETARLLRKYGALLLPVKILFHIPLLLVIALQVCCCFSNLFSSSLCLSRSFFRVGHILALQIWMREGFLYLELPQFLVPALFRGFNKFLAGATKSGSL